jgi:hypothetical protein
MEGRKAIKEGFKEQLHISQKAWKRKRKELESSDEGTFPTRRLKEKEHQVVLKKCKVNPFSTISGERTKNRQIAQFSY